MSDAVNTLARDYRVQVSVDGVTNWTTVFGLNEVTPAFDPTKVDASNFESDGWKAQEITMQAWTLGLKLNVQATAGVQDPAFTTMQNCQGEFGDAARVYVRWFRKDGLPGAWKGRGIVSISPSKTGIEDLNEQTVTIDGDGKPEKITNPYTPDAKPAISSISPAGAGTGEQVTIGGSGFTGTTAVDFGGVAADAYTVLGDSVIVAVLPSDAAGTVQATVTTAVGTSDPFNYTRAV